MTRLTITIPDEQAEFAQSEAISKGYGSVDNYIAAMLGETQLAQAKRKLEARLQEALDSGPSEPMTKESWDQLRREVAEQIEAD